MSGPSPISSEAPGEQPRATLVITTKNRKDDLRVALRSAFAQTVALDVIVIDDASTDGTPDLVRSEFPRARLVVHPSSTGYIVGRNEGARLALAPVIFSIDDDAEFSTPQVVEQTLADFDHERIGAVAIPFNDVNKNTTIWQRAPDPHTISVIPSYIGTAHAVRRDLFLQLGGYREAWIHQGEEMDFCLRMLAAGYVVRLGRADIIKHYESPKRDLTRMHIFGRRNDVLFALCNVPWTVLPVHLAGTLFLGLRAAWRGGWLRPAMQGAGRGLRDGLKLWHLRRPVSTRMYRLLRRLRRSSGTPLAEIEHELPALPAGSPRSP